MIKYKNVVKKYKNSEDDLTAVNDLSLEVEEGKLVVILGPSGCGKTTLLRLTNRLEQLTSGRILINNQDITKRDPVKLRQGIGYVIQEIGLFPNKNIADNIGIVPQILGWEKQRINERVKELLEMMKMDPDIYMDRFPHKLSGGQRQRVGVARALAADPDILLMDEPFGALDPINRKNVQEQFLSLQEELNKTIVFVTHDLHEAVKMGDKIAILNDGKLVQYDTPDEILSNPENDFIKNFLGEERIVQRYYLGDYEMKKVRESS